MTAPLSMPVGYAYFAAVVDPSQLNWVAGRLAGIRNGSNIAIARAVNKVLISRRSKLVKRFAREIKVTQKTLRDDHVTVRKAAQGRTEDGHGARLSGSILIKGERIPLIDLGARQLRKGVSYAIKPGERKFLAHSFIARMKSGHQGVFLRRTLPVMTSETSKEDLVKLGFEDWEAAEFIQGRNTSGHHLGKGLRKMKRLAWGGNTPDVGPGGRAWRLPIDELRGPSLPGIFQLTEGLPEETATETEKDLGDEVRTQVEVLTAQHAKRKGK